MQVYTAKFTSVHASRIQLSYAGLRTSVNPCEPFLPPLQGGSRCFKSSIAHYKKAALWSFGSHAGWHSQEARNGRAVKQARSPQSGTDQRTPKRTRIAVRVSTLAAVETTTALLVVKTSPVSCAHRQELLVFTPSNFRVNIHLPEVG